MLCSLTLPLIAASCKTLTFQSSTCSLGSEGQLNKISEDLWAVWFYVYIYSTETVKDIWIVIATSNGNLHISSRGTKRTWQREFCHSKAFTLEILLVFEGLLDFSLAHNLHKYCRKPVKVVNMRKQPSVSKFSSWWNATHAKLYCGEGLVMPSTLGYMQIDRWVILPRQL